MVSTTSYAATLIDESFENGYGTFTSAYPGRTSVISDPTAPLGSHVLQMKFPDGFKGGNAPDIFGARYNSQKEIYSRFYFKLSSGFVFHEYEQKLVFWWGDTFNFYVSIGSWTNHGLFGCWQGDGKTYRNYSGPQIKTGVWYKVDIHLKMNTDGGSNGIYQLWLNDVLVSNYSTVPFGSSGDAGFHNMAFTPVYGGGSPPDVPQTQYIWFDGAQVSTTPIGTAPAPATDPTAPLPAPPFGLRIN
jgi:hypothetical protein